MLHGHAHTRGAHHGGRKERRREKLAVGVFGFLDGDRLSRWPITSPCRTAVGVGRHGVWATVAADSAVCRTRLSHGDGTQLHILLVGEWLLAAHWQAKTSATATCQSFELGAAADVSRRYQREEWGGMPTPRGDHRDENRGIHQCLLHAAAFRQRLDGDSSHRDRRTGLQRISVGGDVGGHR